MSEDWSSILPRREMGGDDFDALRAVVAGVIEVQRELAEHLPEQARRALSTKLTDLDTALADVRSGPRKRMEALTLEELAVAEPDGTVRLVATSSAKEPRGRGGLLFFTEEGRECGGLCYGASPEGDTRGAWSIFTMDQFRQDQILGLRYTDMNSQRSAGFYVWDRPDMDIEDALRRMREVEAMESGPERDAAWEQLMREAKLGPHWPTRLFAGRNERNDAAIELHDLEGRVRLRLVVSADGEAKVQFLDEGGEVAKALTAG